MPRLSSIEGIESQIKISERKLSRLKKETQETCAHLAKLHEDLRQKKVSNLLLETKKVENLMKKSYGLLESKHILNFHFSEFSVKKAGS